MSFLSLHAITEINIEATYSILNQISYFFNVKSYRADLEGSANGQAFLMVFQHFCKGVSCGYSNVLQPCSVLVG